MSEISFLRLMENIRRFMAVPVDNPELLKAQHRALSRQLPMMYVILMLSTWAVAATHMSAAPPSLTITVPLILTLASVLRVRHWWQSRGLDPSPGEVLRTLRQTNRLAFISAIAFSVWSLLLFPYGDAYAQSHVALYMAITIISCIFCLVHLRSAAIALTVIVNGAYVIFFTATGQPTYIATAVNVALVSAGMLVILNVNYRDFACMINSQTEARQREQAQSRLLRMIDEMPIAVMTVEPETAKIDYVNETSKQLIRSIEHLLPIKADHLLGTCIDVFHRQPEHQRRILSDPKNLPHSARIKLGPEVLEVKVSAITAHDGSYLGAMQTWAIVTKEVEAEKRILQLAHHDTLTGLANRMRFNEKMVERLATAGDGPSVVFVDLDGFKLVNDARGHRVGDELLMAVAERLRTACDRPDVTIGRLGGDEFAVLLPDGQASEIEQLAVKMIEALSQPYDLDQNRQIQIGASAGIACAPMHGDTAEVLLARADIALYAAKTAGKGRHRVFSREMENRIQERMQLQSRLRECLETKEGLFVFYQPIVNIHTKRVTAREALVRWHHPQMGWISPAEFIPIAEQSGLIDELGEFVLDTACREATGWEDGARVAVNVSAAQLGKGLIVPALLSSLSRSGLSPLRLEIEVTETAMLDNQQGGIGDLRRIRDLGVRVALDDFGTGYSSLTHLRAFPFDKIKIDGSFVRDAVVHPESAVIVKAIADLGERLGVTTVAEGVETEAQLNCVLKEGCNEVQGYFYGRPTPSKRDVAAVERLNQTMLDATAA